MGFRKKDIMDFLEKKKDNEEIALSDIFGLCGGNGVVHTSSEVLELAKELDKEEKVELFKKEGKYFIKKKNSS